LEVFYFVATAGSQSKGEILVIIASRIRF